MNSLLSRVGFHAQALGSLGATLVKSGILSHEGGLKAVLATPGVLLRYRFTTAREVEQANLACPQRVALIDDDGSLTYSQLHAQSQTFARHLLKITAASGSAISQEGIRMGVMARNGRGIIIPLAAKGYAGATIFLLNVGSSAEQLLGTLEENRINVLVIDDEFLDRIPSNYSGDLSVIIAHSSAAQSTATLPATTEPTTTPDSAASYPLLRDIVAQPGAVADITLPRFPKHGQIVLMSSGTTGIPKGIIRNEPTFPHVLSTVLSNVPWVANQKVQMTASIFHTWGWACLNIALGARNTIVTRRVFDPEACLNDIQTHKLDGLISSPVFFKRMIDVDPDGKYDTSSLKFIASSGHALNPQLVADTIKRFGPILANIYGSTEISLAAVANAEQLVKDPMMGGTIASGSVLKIFDDNGNEVPRGEVGEIHLDNSMVLTGFTRPGMEVKRTNGLISIGDMGYLDEDGMLHVLGRVDDMIIVGGENVHPQSVSEVLESMPGILEVYAGGVDDPDTFKRVAVWVVRTADAAGQALTEDSIREYVRENLADHSVPRDVHFRDELPRNPTGKVVPRLL